MSLAATTAYDVVIAGGGIVGAACALACAQSGLNIAVVERGAIGGGASAAGMGHLVVLDGSEAEFALCRRSQELWRQLQTELPQSAEYSAAGTLWVAEDADEMGEAERKHRYLVERGLPADLLDARGVVQAEPQLRTNLAGGLLVPRDATIYPPVVAAYLIDKAQSLGATIYTGATITRLAEGEARLADGTRLCAPRLVNATGADAPFCTPGLPIRKRKGHLAITDRYPGMLRHQVVELGYMKSAHSITSESVACNLQPRITGQILIGSSRQIDVTDPAVEQAMLGRMLRRALEFMPALAQCNIVRTWTGFRAATPDKLPLIGPVPHDATLWLATGHEGLGITTSLGTAELLAAAFSGTKPMIPAEPYLPARLLAAQPSDAFAVPGARPNSEEPL
jgi:glycine/D-amino acid oxidase-like deaminating enzyme